MHRPVIKLTPSSLDKWLDMISLFGLVFAWAYTIIQYTTLPDIIPIHFNLSGEADRYGKRAVLFILPAIITAVVIGLTLLNRSPHIFTYPTMITLENAKYEYTRATRLMRIVTLIIVVFTAIMTVMIIGAAKNEVADLPGWLLPSFIVAMILPAFFAVFRFRKK